MYTAGTVALSARLVVETTARSVELLIDKEEAVTLENGLMDGMSFVIEKEEASTIESFVTESVRVLIAEIEALEV